MALQKQVAHINFSNGLDTKTDPFQVPLGKFLELENSVFDEGGALKKRNGFGSLGPLPDDSNTYLTTFNGDLTALGTTINAYSASNSKWVNKGTLQPLQLSTLPLIRNNTNQSWTDISVDMGLVCTVYGDQNPASLSAKIYRFAVADSTTGQNLISPTTITNADPTYGQPRVFSIGNYFVICYARNVSGVYHLQYIAIGKLNLSVSSPVDFAVDYSPTSKLAWDGVVVNDALYLAWNTSGTQIKTTYINQVLVQSVIVTNSGQSATYLTMSVDVNNGPAQIWITYYSSVSSTAHAFAVNPQMAQILAPTLLVSAVSVANLTSYAFGGVMTTYYEINNNYTYDSAIPTHFIDSGTVTIAGTVVAPTVLVRSVGLASKAFLIDDEPYFMGTYQSPYQNTYFLFNGSGQIIAKLAYENGGGYLTLGLPNTPISSETVYLTYLFKDLVQAVNKGTALVAGTQVAGVYSQLGINMASITFTTSGIVTSEIGSNLNISGGITWSYDGYLPVEQSFHLYPDSVEGTWSATGGSIVAQPNGSTNANAYYSQWTYEWTDNQGNPFRSSPSIPVAITTTGSASTGSITWKVPTLRLTYKLANPVKLVEYRWSIGQQEYYQATTITSPILNDPTVDFITFVDTASDATILGNNLLYTTGGVLENIGPPASIANFLFDNRLWLIDAEDQNLLWPSKIVIENVPVEFNDELTIYVAPTLSTQESSGKLTCGAAMDDKAILYKRDAIAYINGTGPDITGANSQYSQPIFITSTVGCSNPSSIVLAPMGLMFQASNGKGIWLLGRDLSTTYIGAPVERYNDNTITSAVNIPGQNQIRFTLDSGIELMYDYYYQQWGTFSPVAAVSSTIYGEFQTYIDKSGNVFQETPGEYKDGSNPVNMSFTTSWVNVAGLQGYQRAYFFYLLGQYLTPHKLNVSIAYNYNPSDLQSNLIEPINFSNAYGIDTPYGQGSPYGGPGNIEQWRVFLTKQRCQSFQITLQEIYDPQFGVLPGAGFTLSGLDLMIGIKRGYRTMNTNTTVGGS